MAFSEEKRKEFREAARETAATTPSDAAYTSLSFLMELKQFQKVDLDNPDEIAQRIDDYLDIALKYHMRPALASLAVAFGYSRSVLDDVRRGRLHRNKRSMEILARFQSIMEAGLVEGAQNAKNPAAFIFLLKATCGYQEINRIQIEQKQDNMMLEDGASIKALEQKYMNDVVIDVDGSELTLAKPIPQKADEDEEEDD